MFLFPPFIFTDERSLSLWWQTLIQNSLGCPDEIWLFETKIGRLRQPKIPQVNPWCELRMKSVLFKKCDF